MIVVTMRPYFYFIFLSAICTIIVKAGDVSPTNEVEKKLLEFFTKWRTGNTASLPFSLPSLQALFIPPFNGSYSGKGVRFVQYSDVILCTSRLIYSSSKMRVIGVNNFSVTELNISLSEMLASGSLAIPIVFISSDFYKAEGQALYIYALEGSGRLRARFLNIQLTFRISLGHNGKFMKVNELKLNFVVGGMQVDLENSSWPMNKVLNKEGLKILEGYHEEIVSAIEENLVRILDAYLITETPEKILNILHGSWNLRETK